MDSDKYQISKEGDKYVLTVNNVFGEDADEYCVKASTSAGSRSSRAELTIKSELPYIPVTLSCYFFIPVTFY